MPVTLPGQAELNRHFDLMLTQPPPRPLYVTEVPIADRRKTAIKRQFVRVQIASDKYALTRQRSMLRQQLVANQKDSALPNHSPCLGARGEETVIRINGQAAEGKDDRRVALT